jgi:Sulfotransferase domain
MNETVSIKPPKGLPARPRRKPAPKWTRTLLVGLFYGIGFPLSLVLSLFGKWPPAMMSSARTRATAKAFTPGAHDVLICSFFKSGTNWTMQIAVQIAYRGQAQFEHIHDLVPWIEIPPRANMAIPVTDDSVRQSCPTKLRIIKTHVAFEDLAYRPEAKYVWVVRDPKDVFVSSYHFVKSSALGGLMPTPKQWLKQFLSPNWSGGSWAQHTAGGWRIRDRPNVLFLTYEEMKADLPGAVRKIADLMGVDLNPLEFESVIEKSSYAYMKSAGHKFDPPEMPWTKAAGAMIRRGERGSADELLNAEQKRRIDDYSRAELLRFGSDFPYDEKFAAGS